ncbi:hypothetical protein BJ165DRAFT_1535147 [Panaeolus papilionaceus]|nr:hypothetical protein BJ165DRAFT_1535147 [Panaeolus papilionaceus]
MFHSTQAYLQYLKSFSGTASTSTSESSQSASHDRQVSSEPLTNSAGSEVGTDCDDYSQSVAGRWLLIRLCRQIFNAFTLSLLRRQHLPQVQVVMRHESIMNEVTGTDIALPLNHDAYTTHRNSGTNLDVDHAAASQYSLTTQWQYSGKPDNSDNSPNLFQTTAAIDRDSRTSPGTSSQPGSSRLHHTQSHEVSLSQPPPINDQTTIGRSFGSNKLLIPSLKWAVVSSWRLQDPSRKSIHYQAKFRAAPMEQRDLLHAELYKALSKDRILALIRNVSSAEAFLAQCKREEASLLLSLEANGKQQENLESGLALAVARATRTTAEAKKLLADARLSYAKALVEKLVDEVEEASAMSQEADHQLIPIIDSFKEFGWHIDDIAAYCLEIVSSHPDLHTPTPLTLAEIQDTISRIYPRAPSIPNHSPVSDGFTIHEPDQDGDVSLYLE